MTVIFSAKIIGLSCRFKCRVICLNTAEHFFSNALGFADTNTQAAAGSEARRFCAEALQKISAVCVRQVIIIRNLVCFAFICNQTVGYPVHVCFHKLGKLVSLFFAHGFFVGFVNCLCNILGNIIPICDIDTGVADAYMLAEKIVTDNLTVENHIDPL